MQCKICGSGEIDKKFQVMSVSAEFTIFQCSDCGFQFQDIPESEAYRFYDEAYYSGKAGYSYIDERKIEEASRIVWKARMKKLKKRDKSASDRPKFLDVGCSFGGLMKVAEEYGYQSYGVEVSSYSGNHAAERFGRERLFIGNCESMPLPAGQFSAVSMIEVIEHLYHPEKAMINIYQSMKKGGVLLLQTADMSGLQAVLGGAGYHYYLPGHLSYFTRKNLRKLLTSAGFKKVRFIGGVEFGLLPKLRKSGMGFQHLTDYLKWIRISLYHLASKIKIGPLRLTSSMVMLAWK